MKKYIAVYENGLEWQDNAQFIYLDAESDDDAIKKAYEDVNETDVIITVYEIKEVAQFGKGRFDE